MAVSTDSFTNIGHDHFICQDYVLAKDDLVVLSDGCSTAKDSDWGSRLLVKALQQERRMQVIETALVWSSVLLAGKQALLLGLEMECLRATLLFAEAVDDHFKATVAGDGFVVARRKSNNSLVVMEHEYTSGAPFYPVYAHDGRDQYHREFGDGKFIIKQHDCVYDESGELTVKETKEQEMPQMEGERPQVYRFDDDEFDLVAVLSDGLKSFVVKEKGTTSIRTVGVPWVKVLHEIMKLKGYGGVFMQRRCQKAFRTTFAERGWMNMDDFSIGAVYGDDS
jgi:hypothetical protein